MKSLALLSLITAVLANPINYSLEARQSQPQGIDVSGFQPNVNWAQAKANGLTFAFIKATEGTTFISGTFSNQYTGATNAGFIRGAYHFAHPDSSNGADQANFFLAHGGGWTADGKCIPARREDNALHFLESSWIKDFSNTYQSKTGRFPIIYTTTDWWTTCTGNSAAFGNDNPLWIAHYASSIGILPAGWSFTTFWQYADSGPNPGDQDLFNGDATGLQR
ncbi:N,O-diacetylmuramidase [Leucoagaricus sp. SymC.cos]|nr:N,O-diacetylmuramidase [Leucoagaricus sp. SymC.cos]